MATFPSSAASASVTDCPQCGYLCLGPTILLCAHLTCRKCLSQLLQQRSTHLTCRSCGTLLSLRGSRDVNVSEIVHKLGTDPVMEQLVVEQLKERSDVTRCAVCPNQKAASVCQDCHKYLCESCASVHQRQRDTKDHVMQILPQSLFNTSSRSYTTARTQADPTFPERAVNSNSNPSDFQLHGGGSHGQKEWVEKKVELLRKAANDQYGVMTTLKKIMYVGDRLLQLAETQEDLLEAYISSLSRFHVVEQSRRDTNLIQLVSPEVSVKTESKALEVRLEKVRERLESPKAETLERILNLLLHCVEEGDTDEREHRTQDRARVMPVTSTSLTTPFSPMSTNPRLVFRASLHPPDSYPVWITSIVSTDDDRLVLADYANWKVKVIDFSDPPTVLTFLELDDKPRDLAVLSDGLIAATSDTKLIYLLRVTDRAIRTASRMNTKRKYMGVAGSHDDTLIVSCGKDAEGGASVDVISRRGDVIRTLLAGDNTAEGLEWPCYLCVVDRKVFVSDFKQDTLYELEFMTGQLVQALKYKKDMTLRGPQQLAADRFGNIFVASYHGGCVMLRSRREEWKRLLVASDQRVNHATCVAVTRSGRFVVAWEGGAPPRSSVLTGYIFE